jgi:hypothetical protein
MMIIKFEVYKIDKCMVDGSKKKDEMMKKKKLC